MRISDWSSDVCSSDLPYGYPYSGVWALRDEIWIDGRKVASISTYQSQTEMGPIKRYIFGGNIGARHSCKDNKIFYKRYMDLMVHEFIIVGNIDKFGRAHV